MTYTGRDQLFQGRQRPPSWRSILGLESGRFAFAAVTQVRHPFGFWLRPSWQRAPAHPWWVQSDGRCIPHPAAQGPWQPSGVTRAWLLQLGGWASPLSKSRRVKESMQFNNENWAPLLTRRSEICFVLLCRKYRVYMYWIVSMNVYFPCVRNRLEPQGLITHIPHLSESFFSRKQTHQCRS